LTERIIVSLGEGYNDQAVPLNSRSPSLLAKYIKWLLSWLIIQFWFPALYIPLLNFKIGGNSCAGAAKDISSRTNSIFFTNVSKWLMFHEYTNEMVIKSKTLIKQKPPKITQAASQMNNSNLFIFSQNV
jgi:hypothetical protein